MLPRISLLCTRIHQLLLPRKPRHFRGRWTSPGVLPIFSQISARLFNCVFWNNASNGATDTFAASWRGSLASPQFDHCLVENHNPDSFRIFPSFIANYFNGEESTNLDGTDRTNDPLFANPTDPLSAPAVGGDLRHLAASPLINAGESSSNTTSNDLANNPRITPLSDRPRNLRVPKNHHSARVHTLYRSSGKRGRPSWLTP